MADAAPKRANDADPEESNKKAKGGLKRADGSPWEPITGMLVPIVGGKEGLKQEWTMIELQGELVKKVESFADQKLGDIVIKEGKPYLTIGIHELEGEFITLKKPFVVLDPQQNEDETTVTSRGTICKSKFTVAGVIRKKVLFNKRPRVLLGDVAAPVEVEMADALTTPAAPVPKGDINS